MICWSVCDNKAVRWFVGVSVTVSLSGDLLECL